MAPGAERAETELRDDAVFADERHDVRERADRGDLHECRQPLCFVGPLAERLHELQRHAYTREVLIGIRAVRALGIDHGKGRGQRAVHTLPRSFLDVKVDGRKTFLQWLGAGRYTCQNERGTMALVTPGPIKDLYFGFNLETLLVRVDFDGPARTALEGFEALRIGFVEPAGWEVSSHRGLRVPRGQPAVARMEGIVPVGVVLHLENVQAGAKRLNRLRGKS